MGKKEKQNSITMVVPTIPRDVQKFIANIDIYFEFLPISKVCVIGDNKVEKMLPNDKRIFFLNEGMLSNYSQIKKLIITRTGNEAAGKRTGWYIQQFIKMGYSRICEDDYYLLWDSDTVPVRNIKLFDENGIPFLDCKTEYHKPYFDTISKIFPGLNKQIEGSFIAEHMLINKNIMRELLECIEKNAELEGNDFSEKIINTIAPQDLKDSGFSEYETFGSYAVKFYKDSYAIRNWKSLRFGGFFYIGANSINDVDRRWLANYYDAISFEKGDNISWVKIIIPMIREIAPSRILDVLSVLIRGGRKVLGKR